VIFNEKNLKIVSQHIDTLVLSYTANDPKHFQKFKAHIDFAKRLKKEAQEISEELGAKYVKSDLGLDMGQFKVSSRGGSNGYGVYIENENIMLWAGDFKYESDKPHIRVRFRSSYLFQVGHKRAVETVGILVSKLLGTYTTKVNEIHLATDVAGVNYTYSDGLRFQTLMSRGGFCEITDFRSYARTNAMTGFTFGKGDFMMRIYDKTQKISQSPSEAYIKAMWRVNGWEDDKKNRVWRHEIQMRRDVILSIIPKNLPNEYEYVTKHLSTLWFYGINRLQWVNLTSDEINRVEIASSANTKKSIYYRAKNDPSRFHFWDMLKVWQEDDIYKVIDPQKDVKECKLKTAEKYIKAFVGSVYKAVGTNPNELSGVVREVNERLKTWEGYTLHDYGVMKVADNFVENERIIKRFGVNPNIDYKSIVFMSLNDLRQTLQNIKNPNIQKVVDIFTEVA